MVFGIRRLAFFVITWISVAFYAPLVCLFVPFSVKVRFAASNVWTRWFVWCSRVIGRVDYEIEGLDNLPPGPKIYFSKHQSVWETLAFQTIFPPYCWILKRELLYLPLFGWGLWALRPIAINRSAGRSAVDQIKSQGQARLEEGLDIMIFPEGTRMPVGTQAEFKIGGAVLAAHTQAPVVPIAINSGCYWPAGKLLLAKPGVIRIKVGEPITPGKLNPFEINGLAKVWVDEQTAHLESIAN